MAPSKLSDRPIAVTTASMPVPPTANTRSRAKTGPASTDATSSAVKATSGILSPRGGSAHSSSVSDMSSVDSSLSLAMDLFVSEKMTKLDRGYDAPVLSNRAAPFEEATANEQAQRDYLSGPEPFLEPLRRPSPLLNSKATFDNAITTSALPSPAISITSEATDGSYLDDGDQPHEYLYARPPPIDEDSTPSRPRPRANTISHSAFGSFGTFPSTARAGPIPEPTRISRVRLFFLQLFANIASAAFLLLIIVWALSSQTLSYFRRLVTEGPVVRERRPWDTDEHRARYRNERVVKSIRYYAQSCGFDVIEDTVETKDGYLLKVFKVVCLNKKPSVHSDGRGGYPVLIQHGLFQSCGSFITSEERSLAFWLAEHGDYQVYLGNNRGVFDMGHVNLKRSDPRFWDYNIKELALYDLPAMVDYVRRDTGYDQIAFIGHSQGNATMFCSLAQGMVPELGEKLSIFIALAPAVYAGPLTTGFPFGALKSMKWQTWRRWFGVLDFIPLMRISYNLTPSKPFGLLGYQMFAFLFNWTDRNWLLRRKPKKFRFTPSPVSSASIFWWTGYNGFSTRGCVLDPTVDKWFDKRFPPLAIHHGGLDYLVLTEPLIERLKTHETDVRVLRIKEMAEGEHCDFFWHIDAVELCFESFIEDIEKTRPRYPEEEHDSETSEEDDDQVADKEVASRLLQLPGVKKGRSKGKLGPNALGLKTT